MANELQFERINLKSVAPGALRAAYGLEQYVQSSGLDPKLLNLLRLRASEINGCAYCIDMHWKDLRVEGETEQRLYSLNAWRETPFYTERERAALAWAESVTLVHQTHVPDDVYEEARKHFSEKELVDLTLAVAALNVWNRLEISFRGLPGTYQPQPHHQAAAVAQK